ncbi:MAG TPA: type II toxin-antitoxin system RelE/ParE family toxin, partial [Anaerolineales bacterium]|nr:type II toxin-antitoxin system RelE/ParE family toxin [Anaerolineales bacterium]
REPVREFLTDLNKRDRKSVGADIRRVQDGRDLGMPLVRHFSPDLGEIRSNSSRGAIRVFFTILTAPVIVLLHAIFKKSQKTPSADLNLAQGRAREVQAAERAAERKRNRT